MIYKVHISSILRNICHDVTYIIHILLARQQCNVFTITFAYIWNPSLGGDIRAVILPLRRKTVGVPLRLCWWDIYEAGFSTQAFYT